MSIKEQMVLAVSLVAIITAYCTFLSFFFLREVKLVNCDEINGNNAQILFIEQITDKQFNVALDTMTCAIRKMK